MKETTELKTQIAIIWHVDDVLNVRPDLTTQQEAEVLAKVEACHSAEIGINWTTLEVTADILYPEHQQESLLLEKGGRS